MMILNLSYEKVKCIFAVFAQVCAVKIEFQARWRTISFLGR